MRMLIATFCLSALGVVVAACVSVLRLFTSHTTPGWATTVVFGTAIIVSQATFTTLMSALLMLNNRSQRLIVPALDCRHYIRARVRIPLLADAVAGRLPIVSSEL